MIRSARRAILSTLLILLFHVSGQPQQEAFAKFDVVSVRPTPSPDTLYSSRPIPDDLAITGATLKFLVKWAYDVQDFQILSDQHWVEEDKFDVHGKMDDADANRYTDWNSGQKVLEARLRALLKERFHLEVTRSTASFPVLSLESAGGPPKLSPAKAAGNSTMAQGLLNADDTDMEGLASTLSMLLGKPVVNKTGISGEYSVALKWNPDETGGSTSTLPSLETAVREQLGLRLKPAKGDLPVIRIVHAERPTVN